MLFPTITLLFPSLLQARSVLYTPVRFPSLLSIEILWLTTSQDDTPSSSYPNYAPCPGSSTTLTNPPCAENFICIWPAATVRCADINNCPGDCHPACGPKNDSSICPDPTNSQCVVVPETVCDPQLRTDCPSTCERKEETQAGGGDEKIPCGTLSGLQCPNDVDWECVDDDTDDCGDLAADCPGVCVRKGRLVR